MARLEDLIKRAKKEPEWLENQLDRHTTRPGVG